METKKETAAEKQKVSLKQLDLVKIKDEALTLFKNNAPNPRMDFECFLGECWVQAVVNELNRKNVTSLEVIREDMNVETFQIED